MFTPTATQLPDEHGSTPSRGTTTLGKYRLIARLGTGGMAEVFLAVAQGAMNVNRLVVVKRLRDQQADDESSRTMFLNEARLAARLAHPNVIQTFEAGAEGGRAGEGSSYYLAMEYVDGQPLSRLLTALKRAHRRMEPKLAARICADALQGLHYAHELMDFDGTALSIVHRDVSPQNIMLTYDGVVKIVDFGIAKAAGTTQTEQGVFKGKVAFMAPEQLVGGHVDRRADVFAAGIVLWEAITGQHLMADETPAKTLYNLINKPIPRASEVCPDIPPALDDVLAKALERDVDRRYATAREMRDALESFIASSGGVNAELIGALVTSFFAETRARVQREVKGQLAVLSLARQSDPALLVNPHLSGTHVRSEGAMLIDLSDATQIRTASTAAGAFRVMTSANGLAVPSRTRRVAMVVWVAVTVGAVLVSGLALSRSLQPAAAPTPAPASPAAVPMAIPAAPPAITIAAPLPLPAPEPAPAPAPVSAATTATTAAHAAPTPVVNTPPPAPWRPAVASKPPPAPATVAPAPEPPRPAPSVSAQAPTKPTDTAPGRTFRRDL